LLEASMPAGEIFALILIGCYICYKTGLLS
jgi:hypothetical protein